MKKFAVTMLGLCALCVSFSAWAQPATTATIATSRGTLTTSVVTTDKVAAAKVGDVLMVRGKVDRYVRTSSETAPYSFMLRDSAGQVRVCIWTDIATKVADWKKVNDGATVEFAGTVKEFRSAKELHILDAKHLKVLATDEAAAPAKPADVPITKISKLTAAMAKAEATVEAKVDSVRQPNTATAPWTLVVSDSTGSIDCVFWKQTADMMKVKPTVGETWLVTGSVSEYRGKLQIRADSEKFWHKVE